MTDEKSPEWGPWIEHDGKGCPCVGQYAHVVYRDLLEAFGIAGATFDGTEDVLGSSWHHGTGWLEIIRYRIRKPRDMVILEELLKDLPVEPELE